ncbi:unnamed protein product [Auanema sp. JU1783]|nr:unnamed protein product [Auanema sp. JU1783]
MYLFFLFGFVTSQFVPQPTRPIDLWNPFGTTTTIRPNGQTLSKDEVIVRLPIGDVLGKAVLLPNLPWTPTQDFSEQIPRDRMPMEPNPLLPKNNVTIFTFLGLPYAEPPVANRRFKPPQQLVQLPGASPYLAFKYGASCGQDVEGRPQAAPYPTESKTEAVNDPYPFMVDENCLFLNIFTPDVSKVSGMVYPVVVFFHGGNFQTGSASEWPAHGLASRGMVVVTVNYRLGAFGFLSLGDSESGNYGLLDQKLALEWVRDHIASFGGDPQAVTIMGHDAGAVSVGLHMLSPFSKNLFRSAVAMSGAEVSYHSTIGKPALAFNNTIKLGRYLGCVSTIPQHVWDCIQTRSTNDIVRATTTIPIEYNRYMFLPSLDGKIIPGNPLYILNNAPTGQTSVISPVPILIGMNAQDGSEVILEDRKLGEFNNFNNVDYQYMKSFALEYSFRHNYSMNREAITEAMIDRYTYWPDPSADWQIREKFIEMTTDCYYTSPIALSAHLHSASGSRTWMYVNNYNFSRGNENFRFIYDWMGACRECDLFLMFGYAFMPSELRPYHMQNVSFTEHDRNASQVFSNFIRRFVTHQNPNFLSDGTWSDFQPRAHWYLNFNYTHWSEMTVPGILMRDYRYEFVSFWNNYIPALVNYMTTTFPPSEVRVRNELILFKWIVGIIAVLLMIVVVIAGTFSYLYCERSYGLEETRDRYHLVEYPSQFGTPHI